MTLDLVTNAKTQFLVTKSGRVTLDPDLVTPDRATLRKIQFRVTKSGADLSDGRTDAHTSIFGAPLQ